MCREQASNGTSSIEKGVEWTMWNLWRCRGSLRRASYNTSEMSALHALAPGGHRLYYWDDCLLVFNPGREDEKKSALGKIEVDLTSIRWVYHFKPRLGTWD